MEAGLVVGLIVVASEAVEESCDQICELLGSQTALCEASSHESFLNGSDGERGDFSDILASLEEIA